MGRILFVLISRGQVVLCEYTSPGASFQKVTKDRLEDVIDTTEKKKGKRTFLQGDSSQHFLVDGDYVYVAVAENDVSKDVAFAFLEKLSGNFKKVYGKKGERLGAHALDKSYAKTIKDHIKIAEENPEELSKVLKIKTKVAEVKGVMVENIQKVMARGEKMDSLKKQTDSLDLEAGLYTKQAKDIHTMEWWKLQGMQILVIFLVILLLAALGVGLYIALKK